MRGLVDAFNCRVPNAMRTDLNDTIGKVNCIMVTIRYRLWKGKCIDQEIVATRFGDRRLENFCQPFFKIACIGII